MSELPEFLVERTFDAPRDLVWRAWTDPDLLNRWYGPGAETVIHAFDLRPGGMWLNEMRWGDNSNFQKVVFQEVAEPDKLVWHHHSATDSEWNDAPNPMMPDWPPLLLTTVGFVESGGKTIVSLSQIPMEATEAQIACFAEMMNGMGGGWASGYDVIDDLLVELKAGS
jgi:uncharacterized protein YndB with AHSA1/START domain